MAEQLLISSKKKRKRNQEKEAASSISGSVNGSVGSCTQKSKMDPRRLSEQRLLLEVLRSTALPKINSNNDSWLSIGLWNDVTDEYNKRAVEYQVTLRTMPSLVHLAMKLEYCHCRKGEEKYCSCIIPEFPVIDAPGEHSSRVSLGSGPIWNSQHSRDELASSLDYISGEMLRLRKAKKFTYTMLSDYLKAWEHELHIGFARAQLFKNAETDAIKMKICKMVLKDQMHG